MWYYINTNDTKMQLALDIDIPRQDIKKTGLLLITYYNAGHFPASPLEGSMTQASQV